jgi:hypothetical protein
MRRGVTLIAALGASLLPLAGASAAERWLRAEDDVARLGLEFVVCADNTLQVACMGVACNDGKLELVSIRSGGGAFEGRTAIEMDSGSFVVEFGAWEPAIMEVIGVSGSRAPIELHVLEAIASSNRVTFKGLNYNHDVFSTTGLEQLISGSRSACFQRSR